MSHKMLKSPTRRTAHCLFRLPIEYLLLSLWETSMDQWLSGPDETTRDAMQGRKYETHKTLAVLHGSRNDGSLEIALSMLSVWIKNKS
ncbi:unnamed protein product [Lasius platythorax]|uniref:Uncharacterized protein n=1 Tax=Lasius platythorax TaxID=488582 RepID=A0AAV2N4G2_9HYME